MFEDPEDPYVLTVGEGTAEAPLAGGCLTLLCSSIGTPYEVRTDGCMVMVEDLITETYLVDTALNHLIRAGKLAKTAGFVFGTNVDLKPLTMPEAAESMLSVEEILDELIAPLGRPRDRERPDRTRKTDGDDAARGQGAHRRRPERRSR